MNGIIQKLAESNGMNINFEDAVGCQTYKDSELAFVFPIYYVETGHTHYRVKTIAGHMQQNYESPCMSIAEFEVTVKGYEVDSVNMINQIQKSITVSESKYLYKFSVTTDNRAVYCDYYRGTDIITHYAEYIAFFYFD